MDKYKIIFQEKNRGTYHTYCTFKIPSYVIIDTNNFTINGDLEKRHICTIKSKAFDEGIFKTERHLPLWFIVKAQLTDLGATQIKEINTIKFPLHEVAQFEKIYARTMRLIRDRDYHH